MDENPVGILQKAFKSDEVIYEVLHLRSKVFDAFSISVTMNVIQVRINAIAACKLTCGHILLVSHHIIALKMLKNNWSKGINKGRINKFFTTVIILRAWAACFRIERSSWSHLVDWL